MPSLLTHVLHDPRQPFLLVQSSITQSSLPILRQLISHNSQINVSKARRHSLLFCLLHPPASLIGDTAPHHENLEVYDRVGNVPGYVDKFSDPREEILSALNGAPSGPLDVIMDSVDTLCSDIGSVSETYNFLHELLSISRARLDPARLIFHILCPSQLIPLLVQSAFSASLTHLTAHPPVLLTHLATSYLTLPPPLSPPAKFWGVFLPLSERVYESDRLVFGSGGEGSGGWGEMVIDVLVRGGGDGSGRRRIVERSLEGWSAVHGGACDLTALESLKGMWRRKTVDEAPPDPTQNVSFNLNLTPSQQESRAQVPLPYAHEGHRPEKQAQKNSSAIFYDPDSADDIDDDDPDEDLDI